MGRGPCHRGGHGHLCLRGDRGHADHRPAGQCTHAVTSEYHLPTSPCQGEEPIQPVAPSPTTTSQIPPPLQGEARWGYPCFLAQPHHTHRVIPAQAGIHVRGPPQTSRSRITHRMDSGLRRNDIAQDHLSILSPPTILRAYSPHPSTRAACRRTVVEGA